MAKITKLQIYIQAIAKHEPFRALDIRSLKFEDNNRDHIISCDESEKEFYGLYAQSVHENDEDGEHDGLWWSIADSPTKLELLELADAFKVFSSFSLPITTKFEI